MEACLASPAHCAVPTPLVPQVAAVAGTLQAVLVLEQPGSRLTCCHGPVMARLTRATLKVWVGGRPQGNAIEREMWHMWSGWGKSEMTKAAMPTPRCT